MSETHLVKTLLWAAIEDYSGLWEMVWELNAVEPGVGEARHRDVAARLVRDFLDRGWAGLYWCQEPYGETTAVPGERAEAVLGDPASWEPPAADAVSVRVSATEAGEAAYREMD